MVDDAAEVHGTTIAAVADLIGDKWSMLVVRDVFRGVRRFDEFCDDLGMSRAVLTVRLKKLVDAGVLIKVPYQERPVRHEYRLTPMGLERRTQIPTTVEGKLRIASQKLYTVSEQKQGM